MAQTERKQVKAPGALISSLTSVSDSNSKVRGNLPDGSLHGLVRNLTVLGVGFDT